MSMQNSTTVLFEFSSETALWKAPVCVKKHFLFSWFPKPQACLPHCPALQIGLCKTKYKDFQKHFSKFLVGFFFFLVRNIDVQ